MNLVERNVVDMSFGFAKFLEDCGGAIADLAGEFGLFRISRISVRRAMLLLVFGV